jgi:hypothetical protein
MAAAQTGNDIIVETAIELVAVAIFGVMAGMSPDMGTVMVIFMWGLVLGWALLHTTELQTIVGHL